ncbi:hypothetical protein GCM10009798_23130 [Nocardioides panacihumi]|uniref:BMP family ABC transporter substrate-binding protein n=1 Tax=Nocardioides panacihumi TaxID=400774 RepID=A0ABN2R347_9ACTN
MLPRASGWLVAAAVLTLTSACSASTADESRSPSPTSSPAIVGADGGPVEPLPGSGTLGPGFVTPTAPPPPGGTMTPSPGSWDGVTVPSDFRVVLLTTDQDAQTKVLSAAVRSWASRTHVPLTTVVADDPLNYVPAIQSAIDEHADLVVSTGEGLVDPLAVVTASWAQQRFLIVGAELAEPTFNVTAADWKGASYRGEGLGTATTYDASSFTPERAARAVSAGVAAVVSGYSGYVVWVP